FYMGRAARVAAVSLSILFLMLGTIPGVPVLPNTASALDPNCAVTDLTPHTVPTGTDTGFQFTVTSNTDDIGWIKVTSPSPNISIYDASSDWLPNVTFDSSQATFSGPPISSGNPLTVHVVAHII